jgi:hypothetical protein
MRTLLLASIFVTLAGCSDSQTTAPANARSARASGEVAPSARGTIIRDNKPQSGPTGYTTVTTVVSADAILPAGGAAAQKAYCPAGTTAISGGYEMVGFGSALAPPHVSQNMPYSNGWWVRVENSMTGAYAMSFRVYVLCIS